MRICFVIQPFDRGKFNKRYSDAFEPAILAADLEPYRVDREPSVFIPIDEISNGIRTAEICLADITTDNPNVWFELGFAIATGKEVVLVCSTERNTKYPFDVQHRSIIRYETESSSDFKHLSQQITTRIQSLLAKERVINEVSSSSPLKETEGFQIYQIATLAIVLANCPTEEMTVSTYVLKRDLEKSGYTQVASSLGIRYLVQTGHLEIVTEFDPEMQEQYQAVKITDRGFDWLVTHQQELAIYLSPQTYNQEDNIPF